MFADGAGLETSGDAKTGAGQVGLPSFGDLGLTDAADLRIVFNANEPAANSIILSALTLTVFDAAGAASPGLSLAAPVPFASTNPGIGNAGFVFGLDAAQATALNTFIMGTGMDFASFRIGLDATLNDATGRILRSSLRLNKGPHGPFLRPHLPSQDLPASAAIGAAACPEVDCGQSFFPTTAGRSRCVKRSACRSPSSTARPTHPAFDGDKQ